MRTVTLENGRVRVSDDPHGVIGMVLVHLATDPSFDEGRFDSDVGFGDEVMSCFPVEEEAEVPQELQSAYWGGEEIWLLWFEPPRGEGHAAALVVEELRALYREVCAIIQMPTPSSTPLGTDLLPEMRTLVGEAYDPEAPLGSWPARHALATEGILAHALQGLGTSSLVLDLRLTALAHELYEDEKISPGAIRERFGPRVDRFVEGMTRRPADPLRSTHMSSLGSDVDAVRLVRLADLVENVEAVGRRLDALKPRWVRRTWLPIAQQVVRRVSRAELDHHQAAANLLRQWLDLAFQSLLITLEIEESNPRPTQPRAETDAEVAARTLREMKERQWREGQLVRANHLFG